MRFNNPTPPPSIDGTVYNANPDKRRNAQVREYDDLLFDQLPRNAVYLTDDSLIYTVDFVRLYEGRRPDLATGFVNSWGFDDWGLSRERLAQLLQYAFDTDLPLYIESLRPPFDRMLAETGRRYAFETVALDARRWVYRLATARDVGVIGNAAPPPVARTTLVGYGLDGSDPELAHGVRADEDFMVGFRFEPSSRPFPVVYRWIAPDGDARFSSPMFVVPAGSDATGWLFEHRGVLTPGDWTIEVWVGPSKVDSTSLTVR
jgi:hypothetical protein